jgi:hypothetical protein
MKTTKLTLVDYGSQQTWQYLDFPLSKKPATAGPLKSLSRRCHHYCHRHRRVNYPAPIQAEQL